MGYWLFCVTGDRDEVGELSSEDIFRFRSIQGFWGVERDAANVNNVKEGDQILFYVGAPKMAFGGTAIIEMPRVELHEARSIELAGTRPCFKRYFGCELRDCVRWENAPRVEDLLHEQSKKPSFITNINDWQCHFQGAIRDLPKADFQKIVKIANEMNPRSKSRRSTLSSSSAPTPLRPRSTGNGSRSGLRRGVPRRPSKRSMSATSQA